MNVLEFRSPVLRSPSDALPWLSDIKGRDYENFTYLAIDKDMTVLVKKIIFSGTHNRCPINPRELWRDILQIDGVRGVIFAHNHPSGNLNPSKEDIETHRTLQKGGEVLGIQVLDSMIVTNDDFFSFAEQGE